MGNNHLLPRKKGLNPFCSRNEFFTPGWSSQQGIGHTPSVPWHWEIPLFSYKQASAVLHCSLHPKRCSLPTSTAEPAQLPLRGPAGECQVWGLCCNADRRAEHWGGLQPRRRKSRSAWGTPTHTPAGWRRWSTSPRRLPGRKAITC